MLSPIYCKATQHYRNASQKYRNHQLSEPYDAGQLTVMVWARNARTTIPRETIENRNNSSS